MYYTGWDKVMEHNCILLSHSKYESAIDSSSKTYFCTFKQIFQVPQKYKFYFFLNDKICLVLSYVKDFVCFVFLTTTPNPVYASHIYESYDCSKNIRVFYR